MYRVYNNQPYEYYRQTEVIFDTYEEAMLFIYIHYYYYHNEKLWLDTEDICDIMKENRFTIEDAEKAKNSDVCFFEIYDFEHVITAR